MNEEIHHHGIALPLFSLRNPLSCGIGEFLDLIPVIKWCQSVGFDTIQLLPLNDSGGDASPYSALSAIALHPIFLSLHALPFVEMTPDCEEMLRVMRICNASKRFNYFNVLKNKEIFLRRYYEAAFDKIDALPEYHKFIEENRWIEDFASYKYMKSLNQEKPWWEWTTDEIRNERELNFHKMCQFLAFSQMGQVKLCAEEHKVRLKGDIPILINRDSSDVWANQSLFLLEYDAGAPPDMYSATGQRWGFPIYNWKRHEETNYAWWKERLRVAEKLYHLYRIDHVVGFFRIWSIPVHGTVKDGFFLPRDEREWLPQGEKIMRMLMASSKMLPIGEDLGVVPPEVRALLRKLGIPGTKVYRWERRWNEDRSYIPVQEYIVESMTTVSTHDSTTLSEWWESGGEEVDAFCKFKGWKYSPKLSYERHLEILKDAHSSKSIYHINLLQEYLQLIPELSFEEAKDDRINIPGVVLDTNWTYRFKPTIDEITSNPKLASLLRSLGRMP